MNYAQEALKLHRKFKGKLEIKSKIQIETKDDLSIAYTPGVAEPCLEIANDQEKVYEYTTKGNMVAVITDGTAVLGLGDIGPKAALPVMEGKAILFKEFAGVDAVPICLDTKDTEEIIRTVKFLAPAYGGINLEDISAPRCFEIEQRLEKELDIPVFHDDQHGTAIVCMAALENALKVVMKNINTIKVVINGAGSAGCAIAQMLIHAGVQNLIMVDIDGVVYKGRAGNSQVLEQMALITNRDEDKGKLVDVIKGADVFIGVSAPNVLTIPMAKSMNKNPIVFAMANPNPEISYEDAQKANIAVLGTGRSDYPNQINNVLAFPGLFRGALDARARDITYEMKLAAASAIAGLISEEELSADYIIPSAFDKRVSQKVAQAVMNAAKGKE